MAISGKQQHFDIYKAILLYDCGLSAKAVGEWFDVSDKTIRNRFNHIGKKPRESGSHNKRGWL